MAFPRLCCALSLVVSLIGADAALAQELSLLEGFGDGFLFHWVFASGRKPNIDGSITYWQEGNAGAVTMRQSPGDPCVFHVNVLNLRPRGALQHWSRRSTICATSHS